MPLTHISTQRGKSPAYRRVIMEQLHQAMVETFDAPLDGPFMTISEHAKDDMMVGRSYLGIERTNDVVIIQITANNTRSIDQKKSLYKRIAERLSEAPGVRPEDIFICLVDVPEENWSFGLGEAQYV